jgi:hypothetical protein
MEYRSRSTGSSASGRVIWPEDPSASSDGGQPALLLVLLFGALCAWAAGASGG